MKKPAKGTARVAPRDRLDERFVRDGPSDRVLTVPNALTFSRLLAVPVVALLLLAGERGLAAAFFVGAAATDFLDGWISRRSARRGGRHGPSYLGTVLDPVADRLMLSTVAAVLAVQGVLPAGIVAILVARDAVALLGTLALRGKIRILALRGKIRVNKVGKAATATLMASVAVVTYHEPQTTGETIGEAMFYAGFALSLVAGALYVRPVKERLLGGAPGRAYNNTKADR